MNIEKFFTQEEKEKINQAVTETEKKTSAEIALENNQPTFDTEFMN